MGSRELPSDGKPRMETVVQWEAADGTAVQWEATTAK
jgi:hypothetical protein